MSAQLALALCARDQALERIERVTSADFRERAARFILTYLGAHGEVSGEKLTKAGWDVGGLRPTNLRHWGPVFQRLLRERRIYVSGETKRIYGHGARGGSLYRLCSKPTEANGG